MNEQKRMEMIMEKLEEIRAYAYKIYQDLEIILNNYEMLKIDIEIKLKEKGERK